MLRYNRARRAEWVEAQKKLESDELATARVAYLKGSATEEQTALVEAANREAEEKGIKLPPLIAPPEHRTHFEENFKAVLQPDTTTKAPATGAGVFGIVTGLFGGSSSSSSSETIASVTTAAQEAGTPASTAAKSVWEQEKENQRNGGSLDQIGLAGASEASTSTKKGWWPW